MIGNLLHELSYDNLPNLLDLIENLSLSTRRNRKMPSNFVFKLIMTNNILNNNTCAILSISTYEIIHFWYFELNWR